MDQEHLAWRISSFSPSSSCVALARDGHRIAVRNSNHPDAGTLRFARDDLAVWLEGIAAGQLDDLARE